MRSILILGLLGVNVFGASIDLGGAKSDVNPIAIGYVFGFCVGDFIYYLSFK